MTRVTDFIVRRKRMVLIVTVVIAVVALPLAASQNKHLLAGDTVASHSGSATVSDAIRAGAFPGAQDAPLAVMLVPDEGTGAAALLRAIGEVRDRAAASDEVRITPAAVSAARAAARSGGGKPVVLPVDYGGGGGIDEARDLSDRLGIQNPDPARFADGEVAVHMLGTGGLWSAFIERAKEDTKAAETRAFPLVLIVLLLAFGSLRSAIVPAVLGGLAIVVAGALVFLLSLVVDMSIFASTVVTMIGLGVAIDYSLFILVRYREEIQAGLAPPAARTRAMETSGRAVVYSGITVILAQSALFLVESPGIRSIAAGTMIVVAIAIAVATLVLPLVIDKLGRHAWEPDRLGRLIVRLRPPSRRAVFWHRWTGAVMKRPWLSALVATAVLLALAAPATDLSVRNSAKNQLPADNQARESLALVERSEGPGALGPLQILVRSDDGGPVSRPALDRVAAVAGRDPEATRVLQQQFSDDRRSALVTVGLAVDPESVAARDAVDRLRTEVPAQADGLETSVGGLTAMILDFDQLVTAQLWRPILFVLAASFIVLLLLLRSVVLALKATIMTLLSVLAAYGALVAVFQKGWLDFLGIEAAETIYPITMPLVLTLAFGLSMDYHVFMLSRVQERFRATGDTRRAVAEALETSAVPITSAALIMVVVFLAFVTAGSPSIQQLGFALAVAIAVDATLVRVVLVPATMVLLGRWNWWMPSSLARVLPPLPTEEPA